MARDTATFALAAAKCGGEFPCLSQAEVPRDSQTQHDFSECDNFSHDLLYYSSQIYKKREERDQWRLVKSVM